MEQMPNTFRHATTVNQEIEDGEDLVMFDNPQQERVLKMRYRVDHLMESIGPKEVPLRTCIEALEILKKEPLRDYNENLLLICQFQVKMSECLLLCGDQQKAETECLQVIQSIQNQGNILDAELYCHSLITLGKCYLAYFKDCLIQTSKLQEIFQEIENFGNLNDVITTKRELLKAEYLLAMKSPQNALAVLQGALGMINLIVDSDQSLKCHELIYNHSAELLINTIYNNNHNNQNFHQNKKEASIYYFTLFKSFKQSNKKKKYEEKIMFYLQKALDLSPETWEYHHEMAMLLFNDYQSNQMAYDIMKRAIQSQPQDSQFWHDAGLLSVAVTMYDEAIEYFNYSIKIDPTFYKSLSELANVYQNLGRILEQKEILKHTMESCIQYFTNKISSAQNQIERDNLIIEQKHQTSYIYRQLAGSCYDQLQMDESYQYIYRALNENEHDAFNWLMLASLEVHCQRFDNLNYICEKILEVQPENFEAIERCGNMYRDLGNNDQALYLYRRIIHLDPSNCQTMATIAQTFKGQGKLKEAIEHFKKALSVNSNMPQIVFQYFHAKMYSCDWEDYYECMDYLKKHTIAQLQNNEYPLLDPFTLYMFELDPVYKLQVAKQYSLSASNKADREIKASGKCFQPFSYQNLIVDPTLLSNGLFKLRICYVSADFQLHPLSQLLCSIFKFHDRSRFQIIGIALAKDDGSEWRQNIKQGCDEFYDISENYNFHQASELANFIHSLNIHILFDLNGYTSGGRQDALSLRPAPIQISFMGFCTSMGADFIDYMVTDEIASPQSCVDKFYSEKAIYMPYTYYVNDYMQSSQYCLNDESQRYVKRQTFGLPENKFVFANFNNLYKLDPETFNVWMNILKRVPKSVLWLLEFPKDAKENLRKEAAERGIDPDRIIMTPQIPKHEHINRLFLADLSLDNPMVNGHTTTTDLLWSGVPQITFPYSENMPSRVAASIVLALECPEMIAYSYQEYEEKAVAYAQNHSKYELYQEIKLTQQITQNQSQILSQEDNIIIPESVLTRPNGSMELKRLKAKIMRNRLTTPLFNTRMWVSHLEVGLLEVWRSYNMGVKQHIRVKDLLQQQANGI